MKIIQFSDSFLPITDGVGNVVYQYAVHMTEKGHEVYVVAPQTNTGYRGNFPFEMIDYIGFQFSSLQNYKVGVPGLDANCQARLNMIDADIVHVHTPLTAGQAGIQYAQTRQIPIIGTFHSNYYDDILQATGMELLATLGSKIVGGFYNKCDEVWAVSKTSRKTLRSYGCKQPVRIMGNGTDIIDVSGAVQKQVEKDYCLSGVPVLLYLGQMNWKKNIRCALEAAARLSFDYHLILAGSGPHSEEIKKLIEELHISNRVSCIGFVKDEAVKTALYAAADLFIFPSLYDTFGLVVREAAAAGTPSVTVRKSGAAECIKDHYNGFLCQDSPEDLARVISEALEDRERLQEIGETAKKTIPVPWEKIAGSVLRRYQYLVRRNTQISDEKEKKKIKRNGSKKQTDLDRNTKESTNGV